MNLSKVFQIALISIFALNLTGCSILGGRVKEVTVNSVPLEKTPLGLKPPAPVKFQKLEWIVITPENASRVWERLRSQKTDTVLFALTDTGYQQLSLDFAEIRSFISNQRFIIQKYQEYYEPGKPDSKSEKNK